MKQFENGHILFFIFLLLRNENMGSSE